MTGTPIPTKRIRFEFYKVSLPDKSPKFEALLREASKIAAHDKRTKLKGGGPVRWEFLERLTNGLWVGDMTKIRDDVVPNKASRSRPRERLVIAEDEGTTEDTVFAFFPALDVLVCQSNRYGVGAFAIVSYFAELAKVRGVTDAFPILTAEGAEEMENFSYFDSVIYKVARPNKGPVAKTGLKSVDSQIDQAAEVQAKYFEVSLTVGRAKAKMVPDKVRQLVSALTGLIGDGKKDRLVRKLKVAGQTKDGTYEEFDLLHNRLVSPQDIPISADRDMPYPERKVAVQRAFAEHQEYLTEMYKPGREEHNGDNQDTPMGDGEGD